MVCHIHMQTIKTYWTIELGCRTNVILIEWTSDNVTQLRYVYLLMDIF